MPKTLTFNHRHKTFEFRLTDDGAIELWLDGCLRKRREASGKEPQYVWTNVELEWEEHHYIEARYWAGSGNSTSLLTAIRCCSRIYGAKGCLLCLSEPTTPPMLR